MALRTKIYGYIHAALTGANDFAAPRYDLTPALTPIDLTEGVGDNQADLLFADERTLAASASEDLDLSGVLTSPLGATIAAVRIKAILIKAAAGNTNDVIVGGAATNAFVGPFGAAANTHAVRPGGVYLAVAPKAGWPVTAATADLLRIANGGAGTDVTYDVVLIGASA